MAKRKDSFKIPGLSFSWSRALGIAQARQKFARSTGIPTSKAGLYNKIGRSIAGGCCVPFFVMSLILIKIWF